MQLVMYFGPVAILDLLEFLFDDGGCCFFIILIVIVIIGLLLNRSKPNTCSHCGHPNQKNAVFCSKCGTAIVLLKTPMSFYPNLILRIRNWKQWGWISDATQRRLEQLHEADEQVFRGVKPEMLVHMTEQYPESEEALVDFSQYENLTEDASEVESVLPPPATVPEELKSETEVTIEPETIPTHPAVLRAVEAEPIPLAEHAVAQPVSVPPPPPRKLSDILRTFMDANNIKLGEFVAGLLIVIGSVGLVTALNATFKDTPYLPSFVFLTIVSLFHIAGVYSFKKWNLTSSSRVVLLIGNLLIPLNVLVTTLGDTSFGEHKILFPLAILVAALSFGAMSFYSAKILSPDRPWPLVIGLLGPCLSQLVIKMYMINDNFESSILNTNALILLPIAFISFAILSEHRYFRKRDTVTVEDAFSLIRVLGISLFSLGSSIALLFHRVESPGPAIELSQYLSNPLMIVCFIIVSSGMLIYRRISSADHLKLQMSGMWMAVTGTMGIVISLLLAVPNLDSMIVASFVGAILALVFGYVTRITFLTAAGTLCIGLGVWSIYLKAQYGVISDTNPLIDLRNLFGDGMSSVLFTITAILAGVSHYFFATVENRDRPEFSQAGYLGVLLLAAVGFLSAIASHLPFIDGSNRDLTLGVFAIYAVAALAWSTCSVRRSVHLGATVLSLIAALKLANTQFVEDWHWLPSVDFFGRLSVLCWTMLTAYVLTGIAKRVLFSGPSKTASSDSTHQSDPGAAQFALDWTLSIVTLLFVMTSLLQFHIYLDLAAYSTAVGQGIMLIVIALLLALTHRTDWTWMLVQIQTMITVGAVVTLIYSNTFELADEFRRWTWDHIKIQMIVLSLGMLAWTAIRKVCQQSARAQQVVVTDLMYVDFVFHALATVIVYGIWVFSLVGPLHKVYPESEFLESLLSFYGTGQGFITMTDWSLWVVNLLAWISVIPDRHRRVSSFFGLLTLSALPMLVSTSLVEVADGNEKALIHYLKWGYGLFGLAVTALVCTDQWWWRALQNRFPRLMANQDEKSEGVNAEYTWMALRIVSFVAASLPVIVLTMAHFVYTSSVSGIGDGSNPTVLLQSPGQISEQVAMWNFGGPFFLLVIAAWICAVRSLRPLYLVVALPMWLLGWMFFDLINVWADGDDLTVAAGCGTFKWGLLGLGIYGLVWAVAGMKTVGRGLHQLFQRSAASTFVYGFMMVTAVLLMLAAVFDAFIVIDHVSDLDQWLDDWKPAFADWAAFATAIILPLACWIYDRQWEGRGKISYFVIALLTLNANLAHWLVTDVPETSVLFNQTIGWLVAITLAVAVFGYLARFVWDQRAGHEQRWDLIRANQSHWIGGISCLSMMSYLAIGIFLSIENVNLVYSDGLLLSLMGIVVVATLILSHLIQDGVTNVVGLLFATPLIILLAIKCSSLGMESVTRIIPDLAFVLEKQDQAIIRLIMGGFGVFAILGYLIQSGCQVVIGLPQHRDQISLLIRRGLLSVVLTAFLIHSVVALILAPHFQNVIWVHFPADLLIAGILLVALYINARGTRFDSLIPLAYILGLGCGATLLVGWHQGLNAPHAQEYYFVVWMSLAAYLGLWGVLYRFKQAVIFGLKTAGVADIRELVGLNRDVIARCQFWCGLVVASVAMLSTFYLVQADDRVSSYRYWAALMPLLVMLGMETLRESRFAEFRMRAIFSLPLVSVTILLWAGLGESIESEIVWFHRAVRVFITYSLIVTAVFFGRKQWNLGSWDSQIQTGLRSLSFMTIFSFIFVFLMEAVLMQGPRTSLSEVMTVGELIGLSIGIIAMGVMLLVMSLRPDYSPFQNMTVGKQKMFVYFAELMLFAFLWQVNLGQPDLFNFFGQQWPFVILVIAFVGVFVSEMFRRRETHVLAEPIHNTAFFLPAIPVLTLWIFPTEGGSWFNEYSFVFFGAAVINLLMAGLRKSFLHSVLAAISGNASLWLYFTESTSLSFADDPQFWVLPPAISMLIVAQIFRVQLTKGQLSSIRYMSLTLIYLTAGFEMIAEWAADDHLFEMILLGVFSLIGIAAGVLLKIPQFIYLGLIFLIMTLVSMVISVIYTDGEVNMVALFAAVIGVGILILIGITARDKYEQKLKDLIERIEAWN